jgi:hypothetical protein
MLPLLLSLALLQACCALGLAPRQIATASQPTPTFAYANEIPLTEPTFVGFKELLRRCDNPPCEYGLGPATTLQASVVTTTILSTTSVPCYITTYVTESTTTTETIYSTETVTSTVTEKGTVYIIKYSPTPVIKSTVYESVIQITQTQTAMWVETEGAYSEETVTGDTKTVDGGTGGGYDKGGEGDNGGWKDAGGGSGSGYSAPAPAASTGKWKDTGAGGYSAPAPASSVPAAAPAPAAQANAWTHASGTAGAAVTPVAGVNAAAGGAASGWSTAGASVTIAGQNMANWHNGALHIAPIAWPMIILTFVSIVGGPFLM